MPLTCIDWIVIGGYLLIITAVAREATPKNFLSPDAMSPGGWPARPWSLPHLLPIRRCL